MRKEEIAAYFARLQEDICEKLLAIDKEASIVEDHWQRETGGGGRSCNLQGSAIEKGGVNFSAVYGKISQALQQALETQEEHFYATGLSIILHPSNPHVPIIHMNTRYFELSDGTEWFGGGIDLTPHFVNCSEAAAFHKHLQKVCQAHEEVADYPRFKASADDYFYLPHRGETRGIGGIFFDHLQKGTKAARWAFLQAVAEAFVPVYAPLLEKNKNQPYSETEKQWQNVRRSRYVEFNLIYDAGTKFGLTSKGRTESILISLPPQANWYYNLQPKPESAEAKTQALLRKHINWLSYT